MQVVSQGCTASLGKQEDDVFKFLGYCPQENSLWPSLTVKDHLELYAAVKGLSKDDAALSISRYKEKPHSYCVAGGRDKYIFLINNGKKVINSVFKLSCQKNG